MEKADFIKRLVELRVNKGASARDMSLSIGQSAGYINNIETGKSKPSLDGFFFICEYLGITPSEFFDADASNPARLSEIVKDMKKLSDEQLSMIAALVKDLIK